MQLLEEQDLQGGAAETATPEQLLEIQDGHRYELIDGKLVERHMGAQVGEITAVIIGLLRQHVQERRTGKVFSADCGYQIFGEAKRVRFPDVSFIARGRLPEDKSPGGHARIPPDLAVEVVSPNDTAEEIEARRVDFLRAGTPLFWVVFPGSRTVHVSHPGSNALTLGEGDELSGEDVLPGFVCKVAALFEDL
jgi:Uma2 family endonuclease